RVDRLSFPTRRSSDLVKGAFSMKKILFTFISFTLVNALLAGCGDADIEGVIIKGNENTVLVAENLTPNRYEEIKGDLSSNADMLDRKRTRLNSSHVSI